MAWLKWNYQSEDEVHKDKLSRLKSKLEEEKKAFSRESEESELKKQIEEQRQQRIKLGGGSFIDKAASKIVATNEYIRSPGTQRALHNIVGNWDNGNKKTTMSFGHSQPPKQKWKMFSR